MMFAAVQIGAHISHNVPFKCLLGNMNFQNGFYLAENTAASELKTYFENSGFKYGMFLVTRFCVWFSN